MNKIICTELMQAQKWEKMRSLHESQSHFFLNIPFELIFTSGWGFEGIKSWNKIQNMMFYSEK